MKRRELLAGLGALGVFGAGAATAFTDFDVTDIGSSGAEASASEGMKPVELQRFDAPGSSPGTETIPERGQVTYLTMFATWCTICQRKMEPLGKAVDAAEDVQFVSVTNEPVGQTVEPQEVIEWWERHDGHWPVAQDDDDLTLTQRIDGRGVPYSVVFDAENKITWSEGGYQSKDAILKHIEEAR